MVSPGLDYESSVQHQLLLTVSDPAGLNSSAYLTIVVGDENEAPVFFPDVFSVRVDEEEV